MTQSTPLCTALSTKRQERMKEGRVWREEGEGLEECREGGKVSKSP